MANLFIENSADSFEDYISSIINYIHEKGDISYISECLCTSNTGRHNIDNETLKKYLNFKYIYDLDFKIRELESKRQIYLNIIKKINICEKQ